MGETEVENAELCGREDPPGEHAIEFNAEKLSDDNILLQDLKRQPFRYPENVDYTQLVLEGYLPN